MSSEDSPGADATRAPRKQTKRPAPAEPPGPAVLVQSRISALFALDQGVRDELSQQLAPRSSASHAIARRAEAAFDGFSASRLPPEERARVTYLGPGDNLATAHKKVIEEAAKAARTSPAARSISIRDGSEVAAMVKRSQEPGETAVGTLELEHLVDSLATKHSAAPSSPADAALNTCRAEIEAERRASAIDGPAVPPHTTLGGWWRTVSCAGFATGSRCSTA